ncbi:ParB/RepB/Spo0J family partition protein [Neobittarella massiliensis]|nr:ParB/RepB/Spo0J family partition protein [Neobittarella massiliensis]SCJ76263.1 Nucleoid occlusion protein [uncultured Anaerotruncus sp.]
MSMVFSRKKVVGKVVSLPVSQIRPNPAQPRLRFDAYELISLAESIRQNGLLQPITVREVGDGYELISGERRLRATKLAKLRQINCIIVDTDEQQSAVFALLENIQRQDLDYFEQARGIKKLIECWGITQEQAAARLGMAQSTLANKLRLLGLEEDLQKYVVEQKLSERHARALLTVDRAHRMEVAQTVCARHLNVVQTEEYIEKMEMAAKKPQRRNLFIVKDVRIFLNTVGKAIDMMKQAGVDAVANTTQCGDYIEYNIRIPLAK